MKEIFTGIFLIDEKIATENLMKGFRPFNDELIEHNKKQYRSFDPTRSKLAAAIVKKIKIVPLEKGQKILYLGAAQGYTVSHVASIIGDKGIIYAIEFSDRPFRELLLLSEKFKNIVPILADARKPEQYNWIEKTDIVYCDIAQPDQTEIAIRNCKIFLKEKGYLFLSIKTRSIDVTRDSKEIAKEEINKLKDFEIVDWKMLDPFEEGHAFVIAQFHKSR
jgi:fibrillarin-like pre-rRNA processing protein